MDHRVFLSLGSGLLVAVIGCGGGEPAGRVEVPDKLTLYSIDGRNHGSSLPPGPAAGETFHGDPVLGKVVIEDAKRREALIAALNRGLAASDGTMAKCFWPRHGLRAERNGTTVDYVICFECLQVATHRGESVVTVAIDKSPLPAFNDEIKRALLPLAPSGIKGSD